MAYYSLKQDEHDEELGRFPVRFRRDSTILRNRLLRYKQWIVMALGGLVLFALAIVLMGNTNPQLQPFQQTLEQKPAYLRLLLPTSMELFDTKTPRLNLMMCKAILTTQVLGYPTPTLINFKQDVHQAGMKVAGGTHLAKIRGIRTYLNSLMPENDDDLVMAFDATDTWFQLGPEILLQRYEEMTVEANRRLAKQYPLLTKTGKVSQKIFVSAQKGCGLNQAQAKAPGCLAAPWSSLPKDVFGPDTDKTFNNENRWYRMQRPRWVNSGFVMGPVSAMRDLFQRAEYMLDEENMANIGSDQFIFTEMMGQQEVWRRQQEAALEEAMGKGTTFDNVRDAFLRKFGSVAKRSPKKKDNPKLEGIYKLRNDMSYELGFGLDEASRLVQVAWSFEDEIEFVVHNNTQAISKLVSSRKLGRHAPFTLPADVAAISAPFSPLISGVEDQQEQNTITWNDVPLVTNFYTGEVPAGVHLCGAPWKKRINSHWNKPWYHPKMRALLDAAVLAPTHSLAVTEVEGQRREWLSSHEQRGMLHTDQMPRYTSFGDVCGQHWKVLLDDGEGDWVNPMFERVGGESESEPGEAEPMEEVESVKDIEPVQAKPVEESKPELPTARPLNGSAVYKWH